MMSEMDPNEIIEFEVRQHVRTTRERFEGFLEAVKEVALEPISTEIVTPEGEMTLFEVPIQPLDPSVVLFDEFHIFYKYRFKDETTSSLPNQLKTRIIRGVPVETLIPDGKGGVKGAQLAALEQLLVDVEAGKTDALPRDSDSKTRKLFKEFLEDRRKKNEMSI